MGTALSALREHIDHIRIVDTHEHMGKEADWVDNGSPDVLADLLDNYVPADFISAGMDGEQFHAIVRDPDRSQSERWSELSGVWDHLQFTGYGEAVRLLAKSIYGIEEIDGPALERAQPIHDALRQPGERYRLLHDVAHLDHIQTDDFVWPCLPDESGRDFFFYDISWASFCGGNVDLEALKEETGVTVQDLDSCQDAMRAIFAKYANVAIAVKAQHAYNRTLRWQPREEADVAVVLKKMCNGGELTTAEKLCFGDWAWARGCELAAEHNLPFKIHTGYYAGNGSMVVDRIRAGNMCELFMAYPETRFVLMHIAYPYSDEFIALVKHFANAYADLCWAWSINPYASMDFVRRFIHAAPANKLFAFGGDVRNPTSAVAYAIQARSWLSRALAAEVDDGYMSVAQAKRLADKLLSENQYACFDIDGCRAAAGA